MATRFIWQATLDSETRERLQQKINATLDRWEDLPENPAQVIVSRPELNFLDERVTLEVVSESGRLLAAGRLKPPES
jgi:hypothetical protein